MTGSTVIPTLRYRDAARAIHFLCTAFGLERQFVVPGTERAIEHAQVTLGSGMVMLGSLPDGATPQTGPGIYCVVADVDAHHAQAVAAGASIETPPRETDYGSREYAARDLEGHLWHFGTYDPWARPSGET